MFPLAVINYSLLTKSGYGSGRYAVQLFESGREMGLVFEADFGIYICYFPPYLLHQVLCHFQPFPYQPLFGSEVALFLEVPLEGGKASSGVVC